jgi:hypothetical protein
MFVAIQLRYLSSHHPLSKNIKIHTFKSIILPAVMYWNETWSLTLKEEHRLKISDSRMLRRIWV